MNKELISELRVLTGAGMKDCRDALEEASWDLQKAIDIVKTKGLNIVSGREGKVASEGLIGIKRWNEKWTAMVEVNCQTDFTANSPEFKDLVSQTVDMLCAHHHIGTPFDPKTPTLESSRQSLVSKTKENVVVRRWWVEESLDENCRTFSYVHSNHKIGVLLSLKAPNKTVADSEEFANLASDLAMQAAAMNPIAVSIESLPAEETARQRAIFEAQLTELKKPQAAWAKILDGKFGKWHTEVCLLEQDSIVKPKTSIKQVIADFSQKVGGTVEVINFIRGQVGEGIEVKQENFADEVALLIGK